MRAGRAELTFEAGEQPRILSVVEGRLVTPEGETLMRGDNVIIPFSVKKSFIAQTDTLALVTEQFS
jgi:hypothetical protein